MQKKKLKAVYHYQPLLSRSTCEGVKGHVLAVPVGSLLGWKRGDYAICDAILCFGGSQQGSLSLRFPLQRGDWASSFIQKWLKLIMKVYFSLWAEPPFPKNHVEAHNTTKQTHWPEKLGFLCTALGRSAGHSVIWQWHSRQRFHRWHGIRLSQLKTAKMAPEWTLTALFLRWRYDNFALVRVQLEQEGGWCYHMLLQVGEV